MVGKDARVRFAAVVANHRMTVEELEIRMMWQMLALGLKLEIVGNSGFVGSLMLLSVFVLWVSRKTVQLADSRMRCRGGVA